MLPLPRHRGATAAAWLSLLLPAALVSAESMQPSQYCRRGLNSNGIDFCVATQLYHNHSSSAHDVYLTLSVRRLAESAALGWTAVGFGDAMEGALMFILYGDAQAESSKPTLSVRTTKEHHMAPVLIANTPDRVHDVDVEVLKSGWSKSKDAKYYTGEVSAVCYGCTSWGGATIDDDDISQPWIWAWNTDQDMQPYAQDTQIHKHNMIGGGFGSFYVDMKSATSHHADGAPAIAADASNNVNASDEPIKASKEKPGFWAKVRARPLANLHGFCMGLSFLLIFPLGAMAIRSGSSKSFKFHWTIQLTAMIVAFIGAITAIIMTDGDLFGSTHQIVGTSICVLIIVQGVLGWKHHVDFLRIRRRTSISYAHITLGFTILVGGWLNVLSGQSLFGFGKFWVAMTAILELVELGIVGCWSWAAARRRGAAGVVKVAPEASESYFALDDMDESDEDDEAAGLASGGRKVERH